MTKSHKTKISLVVAVDQRNGIGKENQLLWHLPNDLRHFKRITTGKTILMGRKTLESIGRPLPNRKNIVLSKQIPPTQESDLRYCASLEEALELTKFEEEIFVIGGGNIYKQMLPIATYIYLTKVDATFDADTFFPQLDPTEWQIISSENHPADDKHAFSFTFIEMARVKATK